MKPLRDAIFAGASIFSALYSLSIGNALMACVNAGFAVMWTLLCIANITREGRK